MKAGTERIVLTSVVLAVLLMSGVSLVSMQSVDSEVDYGGTDSAGWSNSVIVTTGTIPAGEYKLNANVVLTGKLTVAKDTVVKIDLNGNTIKAASNLRAFEVSGTLVLQDYAHRSGIGAGSIIGSGTVTEDGGCIIINSGGTVDLNDITIKGFRSNGVGGAIYVSSRSTLNMYGATIGDSNVVTKSNISGNSALDSSNPWINHESESKGNISGKQGGGIYVCGTFTMYSGKICGNVALSNTGNEGGGGLFIDSGSTVDIRSGNIDYNVGNCGGAIYSKGLPKIGSDSGSVQFKGNIAMSLKNSGNCGNGGAIYLGGSSSNAGTLEFKKVSFIGNISSRFGGAVEIQYIPTKEISFSGCTFRSNHSIDMDAGALVIDYNSEITVNMSDGSIMDGNVSGYREGSGGSVSGTLNGGAICFYQGSITLNLNDTEIFNNKAYSGGAFYCRPGCISATVTGGIIHDNYAKDSGGAFYVGTKLTLGSASSDYPMIFCNTTDGSGGAIYVNSGIFTMNGGSITTNQAGTAGAIYCLGDVTLNGGTITDNQATGCKDIYVGGGNNLKVDGATVRNNTLESVTEVITVEGTATFVSGYIYYNRSVGGETIAKMNVNGTVKVVSADIVNCKVVVGNNAYVYSSSQGRLPDKNIKSTDGEHVEVRQYYSADPLYAFVMVPKSAYETITIKGIIDATVLSAGGVTDTTSWYPSWNDQSDEKKIVLLNKVNSLQWVIDESSEYYVMYSTKTDNINYTVKFNLDGGSIISPSGEFQYSITVSDGTVSFSWPDNGNPTIAVSGTGVDYNISFNAEKGGYTFVGWLLGGSGDPIKNAEYEMSDLFKEDTVVTFYAKWNPIGYTIKYSPNGGSGSMINQVTKSAEVVLDYTYSGENNGYIFIGWNTQADGKGEHYATGQSHEFTEPLGSTIILYAQWIRPSYSGSLTIGST